MRVTYIGQASTLIEVAGKKILTDPWLTEGAYYGTWFHPHLLADAGLTLDTFPRDIDYLFLSHEHLDHVEPESIRHFAPDTPVLICEFATPKFKRYLAGLGLTNVRELRSGQEEHLGDGVKATIFNTAEYTNDSALLVEGDGCKVFNETDCKLSFEDLEKIGQRGIDLGFYMFSGATWYPMMYDYDHEQQLALVKRRRRTLMRSFVQRVKLTRPKVAVPSSGPCMVLEPDLLWLNSTDRGIFVDPVLAVEALQAASLPCQAQVMTSSDVWDSRTGFERHSPDAFHIPRADYIRDASARMTPWIRARQAAEAPAAPGLGDRLVTVFQELVAAQTPDVRQRIGSKLGLIVTGEQSSQWTVDFTTDGSEYVLPGLAPDWTYTMEVEDKLMDSFLDGREPFFEHLMLSLRCRFARRPDEYNEPLYHFLYEPDPRKLHDWYAVLGSVA